MPPKGKPKCKRKKAAPDATPLERMREVFQQIDVDADGSVTRDEFIKAMDLAGISFEDANSLFNRFDPDSSGCLDRDEFFAYTAKGAGDIRAMLQKADTQDDETDDKLLEIFRKWDKNGDGTIDRQELEKIFFVLNPTFTKKELDGVLKSADLNGDGMIDYEEFIAWLRAPK